MSKNTTTETEPMTFAEESSTIKQIEHDATAWIRDVKKAAPRDVEAYSAGCQQGIAMLLVELSKRNKINRVVK